MVLHLKIHTNFVEFLLKGLGELLEGKREMLRFRNFLCEINLINDYSIDAASIISHVVWSLNINDK